MAIHRSQCYMTLVMSDSYLPGAMVLAHSLKDAGAERELVALVTLDTLAADTIKELETLYTIIPVDRIGNSKPANLFLMGRPDLLYAFTKIALWRQTQYSKIVYIDADIVALRNLDDLFDTKATFAAAPDIGWPDAFNSGLMVLTPSMGDYWAMSALAQAGDSFDGADQGLLNQYYEHRPWHRLSFTYNCTPSAEYQWEPAYRYHKSNIKSVHFIGKNKPWFVGRQAGTGVGTYGEMVGKWWSVYDRHYRSAPSYVPGKSYARSTVVQQLVFGEMVDDMYYGVPEHERLPLASSTDVASALKQPEAQSTPYQPPPVKVQESTLNEAPAQQVVHLQDQPKEWQAPPAPWDATRSAPPSHSQPEAANFETGHYTFDGEHKEFKAPQKYPDPPKDMWYSVPETKPAEAPPKPIFPWEIDSRRRITSRKFADDSPPSPVLGTSSPREVEWASSAGGLGKYIRDVMTQSELPKQIKVTSPGGRRESLVFTGMPDMKDRPSLPVTPAPGRVNTFWGDDGGPTSPDVQNEQTWVCPSCGFASTDSKAFASSRSAIQNFQEFSETAIPIEGALALSEASRPKPRPDLLKRERSSAYSVLSDTSTVVALQGALESHLSKIEASPELESPPAEERPLPPHLRPLPAQEPEQSTLKRDLLIAPPVVPLEAPIAVSSPLLAPSSPPKPLPPPAWLTAAVTDQHYTALRSDNPEVKLEELRRSSLVEVVSLVSPDAAKPKHAAMEPIPESTKAPKKYAYTPKPPLMSMPSDDVSDLEIEGDDIMGSPSPKTAQPPSKMMPSTSGNASAPPKKPPKPVAFSAPVYNKPSIDETMEKSTESFSAAEPVVSPTTER